MRCGKTPWKSYASRPDDQSVAGLRQWRDCDREPFAGFVGLSIPRRIYSFSPCVEIGWRLAVTHWGKGYATEAARGALEVGFETLGLEEVVFFTAVLNRRSRAVIESSVARQRILSHAA